MSLRDDLAWLRRQNGAGQVLPTPPECRDLLERARAAGIRLGHLFVLSRPLTASGRGGYDYQTGDVWCAYDAQRDDRGRDLLQCLLSLIACAKLRLSPPATIEEDWEQARATHREAYALAQAWGREALFTAADLEQFLRLDNYLYRCHAAAGELAGSLNPAVARCAFSSLLILRQQYGWNDAQFEAALYGICDEDEEANAAVLDFDRTWLRARWHITATRRREQAPDPHPFGVLTLTQTPRTAEILRDVLARVAREQAQGVSHALPSVVKARTYHSLFQVTGELDLVQALLQINAWLLDAHPECFARVQWQLAADTLAPDATLSARLYRVRIEYIPDEQAINVQESSDPPAREAWVLFPVRQRCRREEVEAAWQRYIRSWLTFQKLSCEPLYHGLQTLWAALA